MPSRAWYALPLALPLIAAPLQAAHGQLISFGVLAGASLSTFTSDHISDAEHYTGFIAGAFVHLGLPFFSLEPGVFYTTKGVKSTDFTGFNEGETTLDYVQIPIVLRLNLPMHLYVGAGPALGFKLGCSFSQTTPGAGGSTDCSGVTGFPTEKSTEVSGIGEAGLQFKRFSIGGRIDAGITNAFDALNGNTANVNVRTQTISLVAAIRF